MYLTLGIALCTFLKPVKALEWGKCLPCTDCRGWGGFSAQRELISPLGLKQCSEVKRVSVQCSTAPVQAGVLKKRLPGWSLHCLYIRITSRGWAAPESMSTTLVSRDTLKWEAGQGLWTSFWRRILTWSLAHPQGRVLVPSCSLLSPNTAFWLQPKGCNNQNLLIAGCNVLINW